MVESGTYVLIWTSTPKGLYSWTMTLLLEKSQTSEGLMAWLCAIVDV
jgi:endo-1,4-beta-D-glucanase Y